MTSIDLVPITAGDTDRVARFLHENMQPAVPPSRWVPVVRTPWTVEQPNAGFMLLAGDTVVGVYLACYSERQIAGRVERMCNLGTWFVREEHRFHSLRPLKALLAQDGYHFTDLTPIPRVVEMNKRLGFHALPATARTVPNLPWLPRRRGRVSSDPAVIESLLPEAERRLYRDHRPIEATAHVVLERDGASCYVALRRERRKRLRVLRVLYVSDHDLFRAMKGPLARHLLVRYRAVAHVVEDQIVEHRPLLSLASDAPPRMFKSDGLDPARIDYLYSELACLFE